MALDRHLGSGIVGLVPISVRRISRNTYMSILSSLRQQMRRNTSLIESCRNSLKKEFDMSDLGRMTYFLGVEVIQNIKGIYITQQKYTNEVLDMFGMDESKVVCNPIVTRTKLSINEEGSSVDPTTFKQIVGSLMYLNATRPGVMFVIDLVNMFMYKPTTEHLAAAKRILRYIKGTYESRIMYIREKVQGLIAYCDSDYAGDLDDRKSTGGFVFVLSVGVVSWSSKKQPIVTLSTIEVEFVVAAYYVCQGIWLKRILEVLGQEQDECLSVL